MMKKFIQHGSLFSLLFVCLHAFAQRDTLPLNNDWQFKTDKTSMGLKENWQKSILSHTRAVVLPHTWNIEEENQNHYGWGWYQKKIFIPARWKNKNIVLVFGAINHTAYIYLNGEKILEHIGDGFNKFYVNLSAALLYGKENIITVACNNDYGTHKVPYGSSFDWPNDGGIIRKVAMIVSDKPAAQYIHVIPSLQNNKDGKLNIKLGFDAAHPDIRFAVNISEENQVTHQTIYSNTLKPRWQKNEAEVDIDVTGIHPWHFDFPNLYRVVVTLFNRNKEVDKIATNVGFRKIEIQEGKFFLNGERVKLMGVEWTAGSNPNYGFAEPDSQIIAMGTLMKQVNCIFSRQHFQQGDVFYDFCDRNGILVQQELPLWGPETPANAIIERISLDQLEQMIFTLYNHPSVFSWGVGNELRARDRDMKNMITHLLNRSRQLDPVRHTAYVSNTLTESFFNNPKFVPDAANDGDYLMMNEYGGSWWDIPVGKIHSYLDSVHLSYPGKTFFISEFGLCEPNFKGGDERRIQDLIYHMSIFETKPYVEGAIYFDLTDYRTHYPGTYDTTKYRRRIHGIYDMYGNPKPSMPVLRELSSPIEVQNLRNWKNGKLNVLLFGSVGLPQYTVTGYKLYASDKAANYASSKPYNLPTLKPGERLNFEIDDLYQGKAVITIINPLGYIVSQKTFY